jgi:hypothetical protein
METRFELLLILKELLECLVFFCIDIAFLRILLQLLIGTRFEGFLEGFGILGIEGIRFLLANVDGPRLLALARKGVLKVLGLGLGGRFLLLLLCNSLGLSRLLGKNRERLVLWCSCFFAFKKI